MSDSNYLETFKILAIFSLGGLWVWLLGIVAFSLLSTK
jgi:hypothetical protein